MYRERIYRHRKDIDTRQKLTPSRRRVISNTNEENIISNPSSSEEEEIHMYTDKELIGHTIPQIKKILVSRGLSLSGNKPERVLDHQSGIVSPIPKRFMHNAVATYMDRSKRGNSVRNELSNMTVPTIKDVLRTKGVSTSGTKDDLINRLVYKEHNTRRYTRLELSSMTVSELKEVLRSKGLKVSGLKNELIERILSSYNK